MIRIGYSQQDKAHVIHDYLAAHPGIRSVVAFTPDNFISPTIPDSVSTERYNWDDIIMYRVFYPLLERIDDNWLIVVDECTRTRNRNDLTYNCLHHYLRQTPHRIVFEYYPFTDNQDDTVILLDKDTPDRHKMQGFSMAMLADHDIKIKPRAPSLSLVPIDLPGKARQAYEKEKDRQFDTLGNGDPDNIPRRLHVWVGRYKKPYITDHPGTEYVARNKRMNLPNVTTYKNAVPGIDYTLIDLPHRRQDMNDFLKTTGMTELRFLTTGLPVDEYYAGDLQGWIDRLEGFYDNASSLC